MSPILTVAKSEYLRRVRSKGFILTTLLLPIALTAFLVVIFFLTVSAFEDDEARTVAVVDETGVLAPRLVAASDSSLAFEAAAAPVDSLRAAVTRGNLDGYLVLPEGLVEGEGRATYYSFEGTGLSLQERLDRRIEESVEVQRLAEQDVPPEVLELVGGNVPLSTIKLTEEGEEAGSDFVFAALGFGMGFIIFMMMLIYGSVVMQGVIDEKTSRVVEVIVSSVKPFQLMMGKVLGIGAMGITQVIAWSALGGAAFMLAGPVMALFADPAQLAAGADPESAEAMAQASGFALPSISPWLILWFGLYFLLGYLLYASLYAAIGSVVESQQEAQSFLLPLMIPVIIAMYTLMPQIDNPNSALAVSLSMIPFTSPISMLVRMAVTDVPWWQVLLSLAILVGSFLGAVWLAARIYRVGILMYGKKPSLKDLAKWVRYA